MNRPLTRRWGWWLLTGLSVLLPVNGTALYLALAAIAAIGLVLAQPADQR